MKVIKKQWTGAIATAVIALAAAVWPHAAGAASTVGAGRFGVARSVAPTSPSPGHLYVLEHAYKAVYRFPLAQDGLPATSPDGVLYLRGAVYPEGLAVDKVGHVFVADPNGWGCDYRGACLRAGGVAEFAAGATGQQSPISILRLSLGLPDRLNMDDAERLYVHYNGNQDIAIFAKGARGFDAPISVVPPYYQHELASDYVIAKSGALYIEILGGPGPVAIYNHPLNNPSAPDQLLLPQGGFEFFWDQTLALDDATNRLYIQFEVLNSKYWNKVNYGVRPASGTSMATDPLIFTGDCGSAGNSNVGGTVIIKKYLIVSCNSNGDVLVYRTDQYGRQGAPIETVGQGTLASPWEMALGP